MKYTVKQLADLAGISIRTLHHYDEVGVLKPSFVAENGYRYYEEPEMLKLQQILFFKELEFSLEDILDMLNAPDFDVAKAMEDHKKLLELKRDRLTNLISNVEDTIKTLHDKGNMNTQNLFASFADDQIEAYKAEAKQRWGHTDAYQQSMERTKHWTKQDSKNATQGWKDLTQQLADTMDQGFDSPEFQELMEKQYQSIQQFYDCSLEMFRNLSDMYVEDPRFRENYEKFRPGLAKFMQKAIHYYCDVREGKV